MKKLVAIFALLFASLVGAQTIALPQGCVVATITCSGGGVTQPPAPPVVQPPAPPSVLGTVIPWNPAGNSRTFVNGGGANAVTAMVFTTPATLGVKRAINALGYSSYEDIFRRWELLDTAGNVIVSQNRIASAINVVVGPTIINQGFGGGVSFYGLKPLTTYVFKATNVGPDGLNSCTRAPCNFLVDFNNVVGG